MNHIVTEFSLCFLVESRSNSDRSSGADHELRVVGEPGGGGGGNDEGGRIVACEQRRGHEGEVRALSMSTPSLSHQSIIFIILINIPK